jgi:hypothetical protein
MSFSALDTKMLRIQKREIVVVVGSVFRNECGSSESCAALPNETREKKGVLSLTGFLLTYKPTKKRSVSGIREKRLD